MTCMHGRVSAVRCDDCAAGRPFPLVIERLPSGAGRIRGWVDGKSVAVVTHRAADGQGDQGPWTNRYASQRAAMNAVTGISLYVNLELVSAELEMRP